LPVAGHGEVFDSYEAPPGLKPVIFLSLTARLNSLRKKPLNLEAMIPRRLKPDVFLITYVRAEARTLQNQSFPPRKSCPDTKQEFFRNCEAIS
jgi:hypothetical protein